MKTLAILIALLFIGIGIMAQDTIRHEIPQEQQQNVFEILTYLATALVGWIMGLFSRNNKKETR